MKIVVTDGHSLNPGDLSWEKLKLLGTCEIHDHSEPQDVINRTADAEIILTNKVVLSREIIAQLPKLKYIGATATGYNVVDTEAARERNIPVTNVPIYATRSVAQMVFAHLTNLTSRVAEHSQTVRQGRWTASKDFCYWGYPLVELEGLTMGLVGLGRIGRATAKLATAFGMNVLAYDKYVTDAPDKEIELAELDDVFRRSDVVSLHCPLTSETDKLVNAGRLAMMKPAAFLINTSRGALVDEAALAEALNAGHIAGAGLDVLAVEPPAADNPLPAAKNCYVTPHIAWATKASRARLMDAAVANVEAFLAAQPQNVVN